MSRYYYAGGEKVSIEEDETQVAFDLRQVESASLRSTLEGIEGSRLPGGVVLAARSALDDKDIGHLRKAGALRPVFRHGKGVMVALPEIRVEVDDERQRRAVLDSIGRAPHPVEVAEQDSDCFLLRPKSGSGDEALDVANFVYEQARPAAASVRFLQVVPRPDTHR